MRAELAKELNRMSESISAASKTLAYESKLFDVRKLAAFTKAKNETFFILCGWMENKEADLLKRSWKRIRIFSVHWKKSGQKSFNPSDSSEKPEADQAVRNVYPDVWPAELSGI